MHWVITKPKERNTEGWRRKEGEKTILHIQTKGRRHTTLVMCVLYCARREE
jgi:hypothetical protein